MSKTVYNSLIKNNIAPNGAKTIGIFDGTKKIGEIPLGVLANTEETPLFSFGLLSDVHMMESSYNSYYTDYVGGENRFKRELEFYKSYGVEFVTMVGDFTVNQTKNEYKMFQNIREEYSADFEIYTCAGNHDMGMGRALATDYGTKKGDNLVYTNNDPDNGDLSWKTYVGTDINHYFTYTVGSKKFHFIFLSCKIGRDNETSGTNSLYNIEDIGLNGSNGWLSNALRTCINEGGQCFVYVHAPLPERAGDFGYSYDARSVLLGNKAEAIRTLSDTYKNNTIWFHGHTHQAWELQGVKYTNSTSANELVTKGTISTTQAQAGKGYNLDANVYPTSNEGRTSGWHVHLPSANIARYPTLDGVDSSKDLKQSQFAVVDVYSDHVVIKGLSFDNTDDNSEIKYVPLAQYKLYYEAGTASGGNGDISGEADSGGSSSGGSSSGDSGSSSEGSGSSSSSINSHIDTSAGYPIIYGYVNETLDLGFTPTEIRRQDWSIFGAESTNSSVDNRVSYSGTNMTFLGIANKNWETYGSSENYVSGLSNSNDERECWFWTYNGSKKYKTIIN